MTTPFLDEARNLQDEMVAIRRDLHQHPELGFEERRTSSIVADKLAALGYEVQTGVGGTGVVGLIGGDQEGQTVLLRFDMDALPIQEENDTPYASQTPGVMHACGHDGHVAIGLGVATLLARHRDTFPGTIKLMFQPAEEGLGGAKRMIEEGVLEGPHVDTALGLHVSSMHPLGRAAVTSGPMMAGADRFEILVQGKGGHGAMPHDTVDAVVVASHIVIALQSIVSRNLNPESSGVVTVGALLAGAAANVIADSAVLRGSLRFYDPAVRETLHRRITELASGIAQSFGASADVTIMTGVDATLNDPAPTALVQEIAATVLGEEQLDIGWRTMGSEDFSMVLARVPGNFFFLGASNKERGMNFPHHHPRFDFDEACMPQGVAILCEAAVRTLRKRQ